MKTNKLIKAGLIAGLIFITTLALSAAEPDPVASSASKSIKDYFKFPHMLLPYKQTGQVHSNRVEVLFATDKNGQVNFAFAKTEDPELKREIEKQFLHLHLSQLKEDVVHSVVLNFKTL
jgi:hypothetical protein